MKFALPLALSLAAFGLSSAAIAAGTDSATLTVQGKVLASACDLTLTSNSIDLGDTQVLTGDLSGTTNFEIQCFGRTAVSLSLADNSDGVSSANDPTRPFTFYKEGDRTNFVGSYGLSLQGLTDDATQLTAFDNTSNVTNVNQVVAYSFSSDGSSNAAAVNGVKGTIALSGKLNSNLDKSNALHYVGQTTLTVVNP